MRFVEDPSAEGQTLVAFHDTLCMLCTDSILLSLCRCNRRGRYPISTPMRLLSYRFLNANNSLVCVVVRPTLQELQGLKCSSMVHCFKPHLNSLTGLRMERALLGRASSFTFSLPFSDIHSIFPQ